MTGKIPIIIYGNFSLSKLRDGTVSQICPLRPAPSENRLWRRIAVFQNDASPRAQGNIASVRECDFSGPPMRMRAYGKPRAYISRAFFRPMRMRAYGLSRRAIGCWPIRPAPCFVLRFGLIWGCRLVLSYFKERLSPQLVTVARSVPIANLCPSSHSADGALDFKFVALVPIGLLADVQNGTIFDELLSDALSKKVYMIFGACPHQMG